MNNSTTTQTQVWRCGKGCAYAPEANPPQHAHTSPDCGFVQATHSCKVETGPDFYRGFVFWAQCPTCGRVGQTHKWRADAQAVADRHAEVGGFESPA